MSGIQRTERDGPFPKHHTLCAMKAGLRTQALLPLAQALNCTTQDAYMGGPEGWGTM